MEFCLNNLELYGTLNKLSPVGKGAPDVWFMPTGGNQNSGKVRLAAGSPITAVAFADLAIVSGVIDRPFALPFEQIRAFSSADHGDISGVATVRVNKAASITIGGNNAQLPIKAFGWPELDFSGYTSAFSVTPNTLKSLLVCADAAATDYTTPFGGVYLMVQDSYLHAVGTDGFAVAYGWAELRKPVQETHKLLVPAVVMKALRSAQWGGSVSVLTAPGGSRTLFRSDTVSVLTAQLSQIERFPAQLIIEALGMPIDNPAHVDALDLINKISVASTVRFYNNKSASGTARITFEFFAEQAERDGDVIVHVSEHGSEMKMSVSATVYPKADMEMTIDGAMARKAVDMLKSMGSDGGSIEIGFCPHKKANWVMLGARGVHARVGLAQMHKT